MKRNHVYALAALLTAGVAFTACSSENDEVVAVPAEQAWELCIPATKVMDADTRALTLDGKTLKSEWAKGDKVYVAFEGTTTKDANFLTADADGATANLTGTLANTYAVGESLILITGADQYFQYGNQVGTFEDVQKHDFALAKVQVTEVDGESHLVSTTPASFRPYQSVYKLTFKEGDADVKVRELTLSSEKNKSSIVQFLSCSAMEGAAL